MDYLVCDTTVVSDLRRGGTGCAAMVQLNESVKVISVVTAAELRTGAISANWGEKKRAELEGTIKAYVSVGIDDEVARVWADLHAECRRRGASPGLNDLWIAATAVRLDCPVAALDGDFARIPGIRLLGADGVIRDIT